MYGSAAIYVQAHVETRHHRSSEPGFGDSKRAHGCRKGPCDVLFSALLHFFCASLGNVERFKLPAANTGRAAGPFSLSWEGHAGMAMPGSLAFEYAIQSVLQWCNSKLFEGWSMMRTRLLGQPLQCCGLPNARRGFGPVR